MPLVAPSILSANFLELGKDIEMINNSEADWFHLDVMDGRFCTQYQLWYAHHQNDEENGKKDL